MFFDLSQLKLIRKKLRITQAELAKKAGISQSMIAKIEAGRLIPTFTKAKRIFEALKSFERGKELKAENIMSKKFYKISPSDNLNYAIKLMQKHYLNNLLVFDKDRPVGLLTEKAILGAFAYFGKNSTQIQVKEIMEEAPPIVARNTPVEKLFDLFQNFPLILIGEKGKAEGIITRAMFISALLS